MNENDTKWVFEWFGVAYTWCQNHMQYAGIIMRLFFDNWTFKSFFNYIGFSVVLVFVTYEILIRMNVPKEYAILFSVIMSMFGHSGVRYTIDNIFQDFMKAIGERIIKIVKK